MALYADVSRGSASATLLLGAVLSAGVLFGVSLVPPRVIFGSEPIAQLDYALHFSRAVAADEFLTRFGRAWGYDPHFMAGYPMGTVFDVNTKSLQFVVSWLHRLGVPLHNAFNLVVFLAVSLPATMIWLAARNFRVPRLEQALAAGLALAVYVLDPDVLKTWRIGVIGSGVAMYSLPLSLSCLYRFLEGRGLGWYSGFILSGIAISLVHPLSFLLFYVPLGLYLAFRAGRTDRLLWLALALLGGVSLAVNAFWILPVIPNLRFKTFSGLHWAGNLAALRRDLFGLAPTGLRLLVVALGAVGLAVWWRSGRREAARVCLVPALVLTALGYLGGELPFLAEIQTYRGNFIVAFLLAIPAASAIIWGFGRLRALPLPVRLGWAALLLVLGIHLTGRNLIRLVPYARGNLGAYSLRTLDRDDKAVVAWLRANADPSRRVMMEYWILGALVPWRTGLEVIGGPYPLVWLQHNFTNFAELTGAGVPDAVRLFGRNLSEFDPDRLRSYLDTYNVGWVVAHTEESQSLFARAPWLRQVASVGRHRIYENTDAPTPFLKGTGSLQARYGAIRVTNASRGDVVLKYHWGPSIVSDPPQEIVPHSVLDDPVPFIRLPANRFTDFVITDRG